MKKPFNWGLLGLLALAQFMVVLDVSIVNVALPAIQKALHFTPTSLQWIVTGYTLAFGGFLLLGGRAADLYGRRKMFLAGVIAFTTASFLVGISQNSAMAIFFRGIQGLSAAFMSPAALSIVLISFKEGKDRNVALSIWGAVAAGGAAVGVLLGGVLTQYLDWRWNFFINIPVGIFVVLMSLKKLPRHESEAEHNDLDLPGAVLVTSGLMLLVYTLTKAPGWGWTDGTTLSLFAGSAALLAGFIFNENRAKHPLMPLSIFRIRNVTGANMVQLPIVASLYAMFFFLSLYLQQVLGYSPVRSGLAFLPVTFIIAIAATQVPRLIGKVGYKPGMIVAPLFMAAGLFLLSHVPVDGSYLGDVFPGLALIALGAGTAFVSVTIAATSGVPKNESGLASGLINTSQQIGGALGLAVLSGVAESRITSVLMHSPHTPAAIANASVQGYHRAFLVGVFFALGAAVIAATVIHNRRGHIEGEVAAL